MATQLRRDMTPEEFDAWAAAQRNTSEAREIVVRRLLPWAGSSRQGARAAKPDIISSFQQVDQTRAGQQHPSRFIATPSASSTSPHSLSGAGASHLHGVLPGGPAGIDGEREHDDEDGQRKRRDANDHVLPVALVRRKGDLFLHDWRRITTDARWTHAGCRQVDGLLAGLERTGHGPSDYTGAVIIR